VSYEKHFSVLTELTEDIAKETREAALAIDTLVVLATPVDTGRARANWTVSIGHPDTSVRDSTDQNAALSQGQTAINSVKTPETIFIQKNLPYIIPLNEGSSTQAPSKFIDRIIEKVANANK
jgi:hypothetical protein